MYRSIYMHLFTRIWYIHVCMRMTQLFIITYIYNQYNHVYINLYIRIMCYLYICTYAFMCTRNTYMYTYICVMCTRNTYMYTYICVISHTVTLWSLYPSGNYTCLYVSFKIYFYVLLTLNRHNCSLMSFSIQSLSFKFLSDIIILYKN